MGKDPNQEYLNKFGENLKNIREGLGISQRELASLCSVDHSHISKIERGEKNVTVLTIKELAVALGIKPKKLLDFEMD